VLFLVIYILTLVGNLLIIMLVAKSQSLQSPMYFFLSQLSVCDLLLTSNISPNMLHVIINGGSTISVTGCIIQLSFYGFSIAAECLLLTVMSYDRYLAICKPLHYISIMDLKLQIHLSVGSWLLALLDLLITMIFVGKLQFCGPLVVDHYFCDLAPLLSLSCSDNTILEILELAVPFLYAVLPFVFIISTYISIFTTIFGIPSSSDRFKAFSTCSSHLVVVSIYYGTIIAVYMAPSQGQSLNVKKFISLLNTTGAPFLNPVIYSLRNRDIKKALRKFLLCFKEN
ncbi:olfactory receptor 10A4-like, partial [Spea bombifrons]|uniref:olfactory receptor 10A4-like n=1 Tax=Spea bombifrons TaxID=233779 RepID=UPI002349813A